jgi:hypothetical protein
MRRPAVLAIDEPCSAQYVDGISLFILTRSTPNT